MFLLTPVSFSISFLQALQERVEGLQRQLRAAEKKLMSRELETQEQVWFFLFVFFNKQGLSKLTILKAFLFKDSFMYPDTFLTLLKNLLLLCL